jgi:phosphatidylethanolamine/phosphatidyl-N-methylethanolamine N-methyltransferase
VSLATAYTFIAPCYDAVVDRATREARRASLSALPPDAGEVLLAGIGTGLDLPLLPPGPRYTGIDFNSAMLARSRPRAGALDYRPVRGNAMRLPFADASFDCVVLHLIVAVVPDSAACLREAARVARPGAPVLLLDKFLRPGHAAPLRRLLSPFAAGIATRLDVVFEQAVAGLPLDVVSDEAAAFGGWFRRIRLTRRA